VNGRHVDSLRDGGRASSRARPERHKYLTSAQVGGFTLPNRPRSPNVTEPGQLVAVDRFVGTSGTPRLGRSEDPLAGAARAAAFPAVPAAGPAVSPLSTGHPAHPAC
jgi:hypothetical protein